MRHGICAMVIGLFAASVAAHPVDEEDSTTGHPVADQQATKRCPTKHEVQPYIWLDPKTGREYRALRLHCPSMDEA